MVPLKLKLTNFLSHKDSEVDFSRLNPVTLVIGELENNRAHSNGSGKSSLYDGISFALFGECRATGTRNASIDDIVSRGEDETVVEFSFQIDSVEYNVVRSRNRAKRTSKLDFSVWTGTKWKALGDRKKDTGKEISRIIGLDYDVFANSVFFKQGEVSKFAEMTSGERREVIKKLLQIEKYEAYATMAKKEFDILCEATEKEQAFLDNNKDVNDKLKDTQKQVENADVRIGLCEKDIEILNGKIKKLQEQVAKNKEQVTLKRKLEEEIENIGTQIVELEDEIASLEEEKKQLETEIEETATLCEKYTKEFNELVKKTPDREALKQQMEKAKTKHTKTEEAFETIRTFKITLEGDLAKIKQDIERIRTLGEGSCSVCFAKITTKSKGDVEEHLKQEYRERKPKYETTKAEFDRLSIELEEDEKKINDIKEKGNQYNKIIQDKKLLNEKIENQRTLGVKAKVNGEKIAETLVKKEEAVGQLKNGLTQKEKQLNSLKDVDSKSDEQTYIEIGQAEKRIREQNATVMELSSKKGGLLEQQKVYEKTVAEIERIEATLKEVQEKKYIYSELAKIFGKNGIQALILENSCVEIEQIANDLLRDFTDNAMSIAIKTLRKNQDETYQEVFDIEVRDHSGVGPFEMFSGGEKFKVAFAIRIALSILLARRSGVQIPFVLYDEAFSDLDQDGIEKIVDIFFILQKHFKLQLVVTHTTELKNKFDESSVLLVRKEGKNSTIVQWKD